MLTEDFFLHRLLKPSLKETWTSLLSVTVKSLLEATFKDKQQQSNAY